MPVSGIDEIPRGIQPGSHREEVFYRIPRRKISCLCGTHGEGRMVNIRWLWFPLIGASLFLAVPGNETIGGMLGDVVGTFSPPPWWRSCRSSDIA